MSKDVSAIQKAVSLVSEKPLMRVFLRSSTACGMTTTELAAMDAKKDGKQKN